MGLTALLVAKNSDGYIQEIDRLLSFAEESFKENLEVIWMISHFFLDITEQVT